MLTICINDFIIQNAMVPLSLISGLKVSTSTLNFTFSLLWKKGICAVLKISLKFSFETNTQSFFWSWENHKPSPLSRISNSFIHTFNHSSLFPPSSHFQKQHFGKCKWSYQQGTISSPKVETSVCLPTAYAVSSLQSIASVRRSHLSRLPRACLWW